jgi:hypothetical protein
MNTNAIIIWFTAHQLAAATIGLACLNFLLKAMLWVHPVQDWVTILQTNKRTAALIRLLAALGVNPVSALQAFVDLVLARTSASAQAEIHAFTTSARTPILPALKSPPVITHSCDACKVYWATDKIDCPCCKLPAKTSVLSTPAIDTKSDPGPITK